MYSESAPCPSHAIPPRGCKQTSGHHVRVRDDRRTVEPSDAHVPGGGRRQERATVHVPRHLDVQDIGDRREDVDRLRRLTILPSALLMRVLHEQRHGCDVRDVLRGRQSPPTARPKTDAVVGGDDHQGSVVETRLLQWIEQLANKPIHQGDLEQMALKALFYEQLIRAPQLVVAELPSVCDPGEHRGVVVVVA